MAVISINGAFCKIDDELDVGFLHDLDEELSFKIQGAEYSKAYKGFITSNGKIVKWDGKKRLLEGDLSFPYGLLSRVKRLYDVNSKQYSVIDKRSKTDKHDITDYINILSNLEKIDKKPYDYQLNALESVKNNDCGIIRIGTGGGKTLVSALIVSFLDKKTIIYVPSKDLLYQFHDFFSLIFDCEIGIIGDGNCEIKDINIATVWTVSKALGEKADIYDYNEVEKDVDQSKYPKIRTLLEETKLHIFDECHICSCDSIGLIYRNINPEYVYGFSASPWRDDGSDMLIESILGNRIVDISSSFLIENGYLVQPMIKFAAIPKRRKIGKHYKTIYSNYIINNAERNDLIATATEKLVEQNFQTLVLFNNIEHGNNLYSLISQKVDCELLSGQNSADERKVVKDKLESGKLKCVIASKIFDIGVDIPSLSGLVIASSGKSSVRALQRVGRIIRKYDGKKMAAVVDFVDQAKFLLKHSEARRDIYQTEPKFIVKWPK